MNNLTRLFTIILVFFVSLLSAQPDLTVWRVTEDHYNNHDSHNHLEKEPSAFLYECGGYYYVRDTGEDVELFFNLRNDGDQVLELKLPLKLSFNTSSEFIISEQPDKSALQAGEETGFIIAYKSPSVFRGNVIGNLSIMSNTPGKPICGFDLGAGPDIDESNYTCVCDGETMDTMTIQNILVWNGIGEGNSNDINGIFISPFPQNQFPIYPGKCDPNKDNTCPDSNDLKCVYNPFTSHLSTIYKNQSMINVGVMQHYIDIQDGYCPCAIEAEIPCIETPDNLYSFEKMLLCPLEAPQKALDYLCPSEPFMVDTTKNCINSCFLNANLDRSINTREDLNLEFTWCTDGFATVTPDAMDPSKATITDWKFGDVILLKMVDPATGCMSVSSLNIGILPNSGPPPDFIIQDATDACTDGTYTLCIRNAMIWLDPGGSRNDINKREIDYLWETDGEGVFGESFDSTGFEECVEITGANTGDRIYASHEGTISSIVPECPEFGVTRLMERHVNSCDFIFNENVVYNPFRFEIDDPCSCEDPLNLYDVETATLYFHDVFVFQLNNATNLSIQIGNLSNWYTVTGNVVSLEPGPIMVDDNGIGDIDPTPGIIVVDFWHPAGIGASANFGFAADVDMMPVLGQGIFNSSICEICPRYIPTIGQWGLIILALILLLVGSLHLRRKKENTFSQT